MSSGMENARTALAEITNLNGKRRRSIENEQEGVLTSKIKRSAMDMNTAVAGGTQEPPPQGESDDEIVSSVPSQRQDATRPNGTELPGHAPDSLPPWMRPTIDFVSHELKNPLLGHALLASMQFIVATPLHTYQTQRRRWLQSHLTAVLAAAYLILATRAARSKSDREASFEECQLSRSKIMNVLRRARAEVNVPSWEGWTEDGKAEHIEEARNRIDQDAIWRVALASLDSQLKQPRPSNPEPIPEPDTENNPEHVLIAWANTQKPNHSYSQLIGMAIVQSPGQRLTLAQIYHWIAKRFPFYRLGDNGWQNSIRHNLSLNKAFVKKDRATDDPGKGCYWTVKPGMEAQFFKGSLRGGKRCSFEGRSVELHDVDSEGEGEGEKVKNQSAMGNLPSGNSQLHLARMTGQGQQKQQHNQQQARYNDCAPTASLPHRQDTIQICFEDDEDKLIPSPSTQLSQTASLESSRRLDRMEATLMHLQQQRQQSEDTTKLSQERWETLEIRLQTQQQETTNVMQALQINHEKTRIQLSELRDFIGDMHKQTRRTILNQTPQVETERERTESLKQGDGILLDVDELRQRDTKGLVGGVCEMLGQLKILLDSQRSKMSGEDALRVCVETLSADLRFAGEEAFRLLEDS